MSKIYLMILATVLYASYNLLIKVSGDQVPHTASTTISATLVLQLAAIATTIIFAGFLVIRGTFVLGLTPSTYFWAALAGICIGGAEITYFYLFGSSGLAGERLPASMVIPFVVGGTIVITMFMSVIIFKETFGWSQIVGSILILIGIAFLFLEQRPES